MYIACQGAVTDVASALLICPEIAERITIIWIGGAAYPNGGFEFNLMMDIHAANVIFLQKRKYGRFQWMYINSLVFHWQNCS